MRRGEVWWADLPDPWGLRPVVLLTREAAYAFLTNVTVAACTTRVRGVLVEVLLGPDDGLPAPCAANLDAVLTIDVRHIERRITQLSREKMGAIEDALRFALDL